MRMVNTRPSIAHPCFGGARLSCPRGPMRDGKGGPSRPLPGPWTRLVQGAVALLALTVGAATAPAQSTSVRVEMFPEFIIIPPSGFLKVAPERDANGGLRYAFIRRQRNDAAVCEITVVKPADLPPPEAEAFHLLTADAVLRAVVSSYEAESPVAEIQDLPEHAAGGHVYAGSRLRLVQPRGGMGVTELYVRRTPELVLIVRASSVSRAALDRWRPDLQRALASLSPVAAPPPAPPPPPPTAPPTLPPPPLEDRTPPVDGRL